MCCSRVTDRASRGRSYRDAPEIDGLVLVKSKIPAGQMLPVRIDEAMPYDLGGAVVREKQLQLKSKPTNIFRFVSRG